MINPATGVAPFAAKFPYLQYINYPSNYARSSFDSLQTTLTERLSHGLISPPVTRTVMVSTTVP
jgi:hypothetical protein